MSPHDAIAAGPLIRNPLLDTLHAVQQHGSISAAARSLQLSYRHVWGELKRWEQQLGNELLVWEQGPVAPVLSVLRRQAAVGRAPGAGAAGAADRRPARRPGAGLCGGLRPCQAHVLIAVRQPRRRAGRRCAHTRPHRHCTSTCVSPAAWTRSARSTKAAAAWPGFPHPAASPTATRARHAPTGPRSSQRQHQDHWLCAPQPGADLSRVATRCDWPHCRTWPGPACAASTALWAPAPACCWTSCWATPGWSTSGANSMATTATDPSPRRCRRKAVASGEADRAGLGIASAALRPGAWALCRCWKSSTTWCV